MDFIITRIAKYLSVAAFLAGSTAALSAQIGLAPQQYGDVTVEELAPAALAAPVGNAARETVHFSWKAAATGAKNEPHTSESRGYWFRASAAELDKGLDIDTSAPGAVVKLSPLGASPAFDPNQLELIDSRGRVFRGSAGMSLVVDAESLAGSGTPFPAGVSAFRVSPELGKGRFVLRSTTPSDGQGNYHVHVQESESSVVLRMRAARDIYLYGQELSVETRLQDVSAGSGLQVQQISGYVLSPAGETIPVDFQRGKDGALVVRMPLKQRAVTLPGLWEIHADVRGRQEGGTFVRRNVKTAFGYAVPQARLAGSVTVEMSGDEGIRATLSVDVGSAGRYQLRGTLYGSDAKGMMVPIMVSDSAAWLDPADKEMDLVFDKALLAAAGLSAPFEVHDLYFMDQSRMEVLHRQEHALTLNP